MDIQESQKMSTASDQYFLGYVKNIENRIYNRGEFTRKKCNIIL